jgi:hypothetical protein
MMQVYKKVAIVLFLLACNAVLAQSPKQDSVAILVKGLAAANVYEQSLSVGYAGAASTQYWRFSRLLSIASNEQLIHLAADHKNAVVRLYCYGALKQRGSVISSSLLQQFSSDNTIVKTLNGCIGGERSVRALAAERVFVLFEMEPGNKH